MINRNYFSILDKRTRSVGYIGVLVFVILLAFSPILINQMEQGPYIINVLILCMLWASLTQTWNMIFGNVGLFTLGHQVFFGIGGYISALFALNFSISPWLGMLLGGIAASLIGIVVCIPCLKLRQIPYIAIATMCLGEIGKLIATNLADITRGESGLWEINDFDSVLFFNFQGSNKTSYFYLILIIFCDYRICRIPYAEITLRSCVVRNA